MSLKIGEVSKLLDLPVETIRFYEQQNIVRPSRIKDSKYRHYEPWDIFYLAECMKYRSMGFSVKEISRLMYEENLNFLIKRIESKELNLTQEIQYNTMKIEYLENYRRKLETVALNQGNFWFCKQPERKYMVCTERNGSQYLDFDYRNTLYAAWMKKYPFIDSALHIPLEHLSNFHTIDHDFWSFIVDARYVPALGLPIDDSVKTIPPQLCVSTIINAGEKDELSLKMIEPAIEYVNKSDFSISGDIVGSILVRVHENSKLCRYIEIMIPVEKRLIK
ncbi:MULTISPECIES: MerR family transcriptional regulator [unclassified Clostridium]|uniref:MerR family transcriptional regulator n=1 Tax=unclassified Clostridium TaxID=2614128 RepID=UPI001EEEB2F0|nr:MULTISPECIES: MerR family transcriptional regulator [unclassified Clostridium]